MILATNRSAALFIRQRPQLQAATSSGKPVLMRVEYEGGHGGIGGTEKQAQERLADEWSFLLWQFGAKEFQVKKE